MVVHRVETFPFSHRPKHRHHRFGCSMLSGLVTRIVPSGSPEFRSEFCTKALAKERGTLEGAKVWDLSTVQEWSSLRHDKGEHLCGRVFAIMGEKHAEKKIQDPSKRTYKARIVFAGNNVQSSSGTAPHELFQEISQTPAAMNTVRAALAISALRGFVPKVRDAAQAYIQARIDDPRRHVRTWVRLPKSWWPPEWFRPDGTPKFHDPVVLLVRALYGHPESGALWDKHLREILKKLGYQRVESHPGLFIHGATKAILVVYVDDLLLGAPALEDARLWKELESHIGFGGPPEEISKFLGGHHKFSVDDTGLVMARTNMCEFLRDACQRYKTEIGVTKLTVARSPYLDENFENGKDQPGKFASTAASHLMKLLFAARLCRPDLLVAITRLATRVSAWQQCHDKHLHRLFQYVEGAPDLELTGSLRASDLDGCSLTMWVDADLASDLETAKSTSGMFLELTSADGARSWPLSWRTKKQGSTASSTCEAEYIALSTCLKAEAMPMLDLLSAALGREVHLDAREDNTQCISAVRSGYSAALRHLPRTERIALSTCHEIFVEDAARHSLNYERSETHKGDVFTKRLPPIAFERAVAMLGLRRAAAIAAAAPAAAASEAGC